MCHVRELHRVDPGIKIKYFSKELLLIFRKTIDDWQFSTRNWIEFPRACSNDVFSERFELVVNDPHDWSKFPCLELVFHQRSAEAAPMPTVRKIDDLEERKDGDAALSGVAIVEQEVRNSTGVVGHVSWRLWTPNCRVGTPCNYCSGTATANNDMGSVFSVRWRDTWTLVDEDVALIPGQCRWPSGRA